MGNILDYACQEFRTFAELPFNAVDSLVLSELSYIRLPQAAPRFDAAKSVATAPLTRMLRAEDYATMFNAFSQSTNDFRRDLLRAVCESPRFRGLRVGEYCERLDLEREQQFAAMTFDVSDCEGISTLLYVAFRGTDDTLVGWKEDFNMAVQCPVPSQSAAAEYLHSVIVRSEGFLGSGAPSVMVGGHSKGGNLAVYAAMRIAQSDIDDACEHAHDFGLLPTVMTEAVGRNNRITRIFTHDGPGLPAAMVDTVAYRSVMHRIDKTVPESSIVGMLLEAAEDYTVVAAKGPGPLQHVGASWQVADGDFNHVAGLSSTAKLVQRTMSSWMESVPESARAAAFNQIYDIFAASGYGDFAAIGAHKREAVPKIIAAARNTDKHTRELIFGVLKALPASVRKAVGGDAANDVDIVENTDIADSIDTVDNAVSESFGITAAGKRSVEQ